MNGNYLSCLIFVTGFFSCPFHDSDFCDSVIHCCIGAFRGSGLHCCLQQCVTQFFTVVLNTVRKTFHGCCVTSISLLFWALCDWVFHCCFQHGGSAFHSYFEPCATQFSTVVRSTVWLDQFCTVICSTVWPSFALLFAALCDPVFHY